MYLNKFLYLEKMVKMELMHKNANKKINKNNMQYGIKKKNPSKWTFRSVATQYIWNYKELIPDCDSIKGLEHEKPDDIS